MCGVPYSISLESNALTSKRQVEMTCLNLKDPIRRRRITRLYQSIFKGRIWRHYNRYPPLLLDISDQSTSSAGP
jgi:hypothetical protein